MFIFQFCNDIFPVEMNMMRTNFESTIPIRVSIPILDSTNNKIETNFIYFMLFSAIPCAGINELLKWREKKKSKNCIRDFEFWTASKRWITPAQLVTAVMILFFIGIRFPNWKRFRWFSEPMQRQRQRQSLI